MNELRHGYTLADIHSSARFAVHVAGHLASDWHERFDIAWSAIVEHLYIEKVTPSSSDLVQVGRLAILHTLRDHYQTHGYYRSHTDGGSHGPGSSPAFQKFWWDQQAVTGSFEDGVLERHALHQMWEALPVKAQEALLACAAHEGNYALAASRLGILETSFRSAIMRARRTALSLWFDGETPHRFSHYNIRRVPG